MNAPTAVSAGNSMPIASAIAKDALCVLATGELLLRHDLLHESVSDLPGDSRPIPAWIRPELGERFDEQGQFYVLG